MEIVGSVAPEDVPERPPVTGRPGKWVEVGERAIMDAQNGRVTVIKTTDPKEIKAMRNSLSPWLRKKGYRLRPVIVQTGNEYRVFMELALREPLTEAAPPNGQEPIATAWAKR